MSHVVLLGDSIFDNRAYVRANEPDVVAQLGALLPSAWRATLLAVDGSVTRDIGRQLARLPTAATHLVVSSGGNDALGHIDILDSPARSSSEVLGRLAAIAEGFEADYAAMMRSVIARGLPTVACTIYDGNFPDAGLQRLASTALMVFNDVIVRQASRAGVPLIDLRAVCRTPECYANPIEPSAIGGERIARVIAHVVHDHDFTIRTTAIYNE